MHWSSLALLSFVTLQRLGELVLARRNTRRLMAKGAHEAGAWHYRYMIALHAAWLGGLWLLAPMRPVIPVWFVVFMILQAMRLWVLATLGGRWTTRIIVLPGAAKIQAGPYRFLQHPNYAIVVAEIAALPLAFGLIGYALIFSLLNALMLAVRIREENAAWRQQVLHS